MNNILITKKCSECKQVKYINLFGKNSSQKDGYQNTCKECQKKYHIENRDRILRRQREHYILNREKVLKEQKKYRTKNKHKILERGRKYWVKNKDSLSEQKKEYDAQRREFCLDKLGHKCLWDGCNINKSELLAFDHIENDGKEHRENDGSRIVNWLIKNNFPDGVIQILCHNHNHLKQLNLDRSNLSENPKAMATRKSDAKLRLEVFTEYGLVCTCCGESNLDLLTIEHPNGDGAKQRREIGYKTGSKFYRYLRQMGFPNGFQTLCHNCNQARGAYGYCCQDKSKGVFYV